MKKIFCDRCGKEFDKEINHFLYISKNGIYQDICDGCYIQFLDWWNNPNNVMVWKSEEETKEVANEED